MTLGAAVAVVVAIDGDRAAGEHPLVVVVDTWPWAGNTATDGLCRRDLGAGGAVGVTAIQRDDHAAVGSTVNLEVVSWTLHLAAPALW